MTLREAEVLALRVLKQVMEEKLDHHNVQLAKVRVPRLLAVTDLVLTDCAQQVTAEGGFTILDEHQLKEVIDAM
jgi:20S proteasome subunit alpha 5